MENFMKIKAESRKEVGKKIAKKLRSEGKIPAIIYGEHKESIPISLLLSDLKEILKTETGENTVLNIQRDDIEVNAMLKDLQYDYLSETIIHADFIRIDLNKPVNVGVPIEVQGESIGVKLEDGILDFSTREVKIRCLANKIPNKYIVDISPLHSGDSIKAEDLELGEGVKLMSDPHTVICTVITKSKGELIEEEAAEEVPEGAEAETPEQPKDEPGEATKD